MREAFPTKMLVKLFHATPEQLGAIDRILDRGKAENGNAESRNGEPAHTPPNPRAEREAAKYVFRRPGKFWDIIFAGGRLFHLENTLGARYLDYLLHTPNDPILAFGLEVKIEPAKGEARSTTSIQAAIDPRARREYERALRALQAEKEGAQAKGNQDEISRLAGEIAALESALKDRSGEDHTAERARGNVRRAIDAVVRKLLEGGEDERAFAEHIRQRVSTGYECMYVQPEGRIWT
jgi:HAMP domain-containing protein